MVKLRRVEGWPLVLSGMLRTLRTQPFEWGINDCLMFPANVVNALTGFDPAAEFRGTYSTKEEAAAIIAAHGGLDELISRQLGFTGLRAGTLQACRGDVVMMRHVDGIMGGIVDDSGERIIVPMSNQQRMPTFPLAKAWRVWSY